MSVKAEGNAQGIVLAKCDKNSKQQWLSTYRNNFNVIEKKGTKMNLNRRKSNNEIRLHKTARSTSQVSLILIEILSSKKAYI